jgi:hypothetical protein
VLRRLPSAYVVQSWHQRGTAVHCPGTLGGTSAVVEELLSTWREEASAEDLRLATTAGRTGDYSCGPAYLVPREFRSAAEGLRIAAALRPWLPAIVALLANSYVGRSATRCSLKAATLCEEFESGWRGLLAPRAAWAAVLCSQNHNSWHVVRWLRGRLCYVVDAFDVPSSSRLLAEAAVLVAALALSLPDAPSLTDPVSEGVRMSENWFAAARDGLQATFRWPDEHVPASEVLAQCLAGAEKGLAQLGASPADLALIGEMAAKRTTQADWQAATWALTADPAERASRQARLLGVPDAFEQYLAACEPLPVAPYTPLEECDLARVRGEAELSWIAYTWDAPVAERLRRLERDSRIHVIRDERRGIVLRSV